MKDVKRPVKHCINVSVLLFCLLFILPLATVTVIQREKKNEQNPESVEILPPGKIDSDETVRVLTDTGVQKMSMSEYLQGVVRAEMPASFEEQALCAQAVTARTYTLYKIATGSNHGTTADVCTDHTCCQAYIAKSAAIRNWGKNAAAYERKIENAVAATDGETILYNNQPILAVFHSSSAERTKGSGEVWTKDLPYLKSVLSPEKGKKIPNYYSRVSYTPAEFRKKFTAARPQAKFPADVRKWIRDLQTTEGHNVKSVTIGGVRISGAQARSIFGLRSATFDPEIKDGKIIFYVTGYGHGVGMSQYGANELAKEGKSWKEIICHYYTGVTLALRTRNGAA